MPAIDHRALVRCAYESRRHGDRRGALALYLEAVDQLQAGGADIAALAHALRHAADLHQALDEHDEARRRYDEAWRLYETLDPKPELDVANCLRPMALWQEAHGSPAEALALWREARAWYKKAAAATGLDLQAAFDECDQHIGRQD